MPATSEKQRVMMAIALHDPKKLYKKNRTVLSISKDELHKFATKPKGKTILTGRKD